MIKTKKWLLITVCLLFMFAALLCLPLTVYAEESAEGQNVILKSDGTELTESDSKLEWTYGASEIISHTFRPQHGETVYYSLLLDGQEQDQFAVKYIEDTAMLFEVKDGELVLEMPFRVNSLNAYLKTLKAGDDYTLIVSVPAGTVSAEHSHWYDDGETCSTTSYSATTLTVNIKVSAYEITQSNLGADANATVKYSIKNSEVHYTGEADNLPQTIELTFETDDGSLTLVEGEDYTLSSDTVNAGGAALTVTGIGGFTGQVTIQNAYKIVQGENSVSDVYVVRWKHGEYDRNVNVFTANAKWGAEDLYFAIATDTTGKPESYVDGLSEIRLTDGIVSPQVEQLLNVLDAKKTYYLYAKVDGGTNYYAAQDYTQFEVVEITNTWKTTPNVVSWEWHGFDENVNVIDAVPAFGDTVKFQIYKKEGDAYTQLQFDQKTSFELEKNETDGNKIPANVVKVLSNLNAGTYYLFASVISDSANYTSINATFSPIALVPFRVFKARNYWTQTPELSNWSYSGYDPAVNVISATAAHGSSGIKYSIYKQTGEGIKILNFDGTTSFTVNDGAIPAVISEGLKALGAGKYYLRAQVAETNNYTGIGEIVSDFSKLPSFEVIKAENHWSIAPAINTWSEGNYNNDNNLPVAATHYGAARIVITDVNDAENVIYDSENNINKLAEAGVGAYLLTATVEGTSDYSGLTYDTIFHIFVPETTRIGISWWLVLILVVCSLALLVFIFWLLHEKGVLQMLTGKMVVAMRTRATMDATIAAVKANKSAREAKLRAGIIEVPAEAAAPIDKNTESAVTFTEPEKPEIEDIDLEEDKPILISRDETTGFAIFARYQKTFLAKLIQSSDEVKEYYSYLKNVLLSYKKVKSKVSKSYDAFNKGRIKLAKITIRGKTLCLYLALNPDDYKDTKYKVERSESKKYAEVCCLYRIKSLRRLKYAEELIAQMCGQLGIEQGEKQDVDYRLPYESTEALLEKGLIKEIVYQRRFDDLVSVEEVSDEEDKPEDETEPEQEIAIAETEEEAELLEEDKPILISRDETTGFAIFARYQKTFLAKLIQSSDEVKEYYSYLKNVLLSYKKVKSKVSKSYDAFNKGRIKLAKITIRGKTLCLYLALNPEDYKDTKYKVERSESKKYAEVCCLYRIKSLRRLKYAEELIAQMCGQLGIEQGEKQDVDYRLPYESTEALLEKGLIKEIVYQRRFDDLVSVEEDKPEDETEPEQEIAIAETEEEAEPLEEVVEPEPEEETEEEAEPLEEVAEPEPEEETEEEAEPLGEVVEPEPEEETEEETEPLEEVVEPEPEEETEEETEPLEEVVEPEPEEETEEEAEPLEEVVEPEPEEEAEPVKTTPKPRLPKKSKNWRKRKFMKMPKLTPQEKARAKRRK